MHSYNNLSPLDTQGGARNVPAHGQSNISKLRIPKCPYKFRQIFFFQKAKANKSCNNKLRPRKATAE